MDQHISISPKICHGKPVIKGTRVPVASVLDALEAGDSVETVLEDYPNLSREDVLAAIEFKEELLHLKKITEEAERRIDELDSGKVKAIPGEDVFSEIRKRLGR